MVFTILFFIVIRFKVKLGAEELGNPSAFLLVCAKNAHTKESKPLRLLLGIIETQHNMAKKDNTQEQMTMEEYLLAQLSEPVILKDGSMATKPDGTPMTKNEAIATNILNQAMKGDLKSAQFIMGLQAVQKARRK